MAKDLFYNLDLNLLRTFIVLAQELNMRKASERLHVSQPAISQSLQKLRNHFDDELFVKVRTGLEPTAMAECLVEAITPHIDGLAAALNDSQEFHPELIEQTIRISITSIVLSGISGLLYKKIREQAPNAKIELLTWTKSTLKEISKGQVQLGISYDAPHTKEVYSHPLTTISPKVIVRQNHPLAALDSISLKDVVDYDIAALMVPNWSDTESIAQRVLKESGFDVKVGVRSEMLLALIDIIQISDMYLPHSSLFPIHQFPSLKSIDVEVEQKYRSFNISSYHHTKDRNSSLIKWLNKLIRESLNELQSLNK
ncbi:LysR family transcriptional regulator [Vibrio mexicanus]|uniref:LysR family transcriptional regulator n=1 Tax=Vibrio mexicanus TaxID=1004326 RepID=UPI00063C1CCD|nr:LysR family transcriptional regulator [Vibrio mexicanus]